uniref:C-type mannose receptor 2-like n=1 Tax=Semicossyphus pulcher TaxID=241346 RepID=UPI0037E7F822
MQWSLFLLILMGHCFFFTCHLHEYHLVIDEKTWSEAQNYCKHNHTDLATVFDMMDMKTLKDLVKQKEAWIGLKNDTGQKVKKKWQWSLPGVELHDHEQDWFKGEPNDKAGEENCVRMDNHKWKDFNCGDRHEFVCYNEMEPLNETFSVIEHNMTWLQAQKYCRENHTDLVSGQNQLEKLKQNITIPHELWIGLFRDSWKWSDGSDSSFRNWDQESLKDAVNKQETFEGRFNKCATVLNGSGNWGSRNCNEKKPFFCYDDKMILVKKNKTWEKALYYCRENYDDLVSITNANQQRWVHARAKSASTSHVWLGLRYTCTLGFWFWVSDEVVAYNNWATSKEEDECDMSGAMSKNGEHNWFKKPDNETFNFICSKGHAETSVSSNSAKMQRSLCLLILMGQCSFFVCELHEYHFIQTNMTWSDAQKYCRDYHTDLARVSDATDMMRLTSVMGLVDEKGAWIGLKSEPGQDKRAWHWSLPGVEFSESDADWHTPKANDQNHQKGCVNIHNNETEVDCCETANEFICYDASPEIKQPNKSLHFIDDKMSWPRAQKYCRENHTDLLSGPKQLEEHKTFTASMSGSKFWIGLFRDTWRWSDGRNSSFRNWSQESFKDGIEKQECATVLDKSGIWGSHDCNKTIPFFCYDDKLILIKEKKTWRDALDYCRKNHSDLVSITNSQQDRWVQARAKKASTEYVWLGLRYSCPLDLWFWVSDKLLCNRNWSDTDAVGKQCDHAVAMEKNGQHNWIRKSDTERFNFICALK